MLLSRLKLADEKVYPEKIVYIESVIGMRKWNTAIIGCYVVQGENQKDHLLTMVKVMFPMTFNLLQSQT